MKVENTHDLSSFMDQLKDWARTHSYTRIADAIERVEQNSHTASELIISYAETLKYLKLELPDSIPSAFRENWDQAIEVGLSAVETVEYEEKDRPIFSLG